MFWYTFAQNLILQNCEVSDAIDFSSKYWFKTLV